MKTFAAVLAVVLAATFARAEDARVADLKEMSVMIDAGDGYGSGVIFKNGERTFVWTDAHVLAEPKVKTRVDPGTGQPTVVVTYDDAKVVRQTFEDGRMVGDDRHLAKVVRYSKEEDIALLVVYRRGYGRKSASFADSVPEAGARVWHVGSMKGPMGCNSVSEGVVAATGRLRREYEHEPRSGFTYDQISCAAQHGSSGGGVFDQKSGACLGLVTEFLGSDGSAFTYGSMCMTPSRRLVAFAKRNGVEYAVSAKVAAPPLDEILAAKPTTDFLPMPKDWPGKEPPAAKPAPAPASPFQFLLPFFGPTPKK